MPRRSHPEDGMVLACPECDEAAVYERTAENTHAGDPDDPFLCEKCSATFDEPVEREEKIGGQKPTFEDRLKGATLGGGD